MDIVEDVLKGDSHFAGLAINCKSYGSSGHKDIPSQGGVLDNYLYRAPDGYKWTELPWKWDAHIKTIMNPRKVTAYVSPHYPQYFLGFHAVDENGSIVNGMDNFVDTVDRIRINHYFTKSQAEWIAKRNKGKADIAGLRPLEEFEWRDRNDVFDDLILKYRDFCKNTPKAASQNTPINVMEHFANLYSELIMKPAPEAWASRMEEIMLYWGLYRRMLRQGKEESWQLEIWKDIIFAAMVKSLQSEQINLQQMELIASIWPDLIKDADIVQKQFQNNYLKIAQQLIEYYHNENNTELELYFSRMLQKMCLDILQ